MNKETASTKNTTSTNYTEHKEHNKDLEHRENKDTQQDKESKEHKEQDKEPIFLQYLVYQPETGNFFFKQKQRSREGKLRLLTPNEDGYLVFAVQGKHYKIKAIKAGYMMFFKQQGKVLPEIKQDQVLYSKNLNKKDFRFCNIGLCSRETMFKINEAQRNLHGDLKLLLHPTDMFSYVVHWTEDRQKKKKVVHDVVLAKKLFLRLQLKFSKILAKYLVLD